MSHEMADCVQSTNYLVNDLSLVAGCQANWSSQISCQQLSSSSSLTKQQIICVTRIFEHKSTKADMSQVLQPLKIRHSHTSSIDVYVW